MQSKFLSAFIYVKNMVLVRQSTLEIIRSSTVTKNQFKMLFNKGGYFNGPTILLVKGIILTICGVILSIWTPFKILMDERLKMQPGMPSYECWASPPDKIILRVHIFNFTNSQEFLSGIDSKLNMVEIGPIVYREHLTHSNITFNENSTISYVAKHSVVYATELNHINLNDTIIVPNYALLLMASFLHDAPFFTKFGFNMLVRQYATQPFLNMTIYNYLWNYSDPMYKMANKVLPSLVPVDNIGMLARVYDNFEDHVTMFMGTKYGDEQFSLIDKFGGSEHLPSYKNCEDKVTNSTEGVTYMQRVTKHTVLKYWRKTICKVVPLTFNRELVHSGMNAYKFTVPNNSYDRTYPEKGDCYKGYPVLNDGLSDVSNCQYNVPIAASFPHFLYGDPKNREYLNGFNPNDEKHGSFIILEPTTGVPLESIARSQSNAVVRKFSGFHDDIMKFSDMVIPMFWLEYHQIGIPVSVHIMLYFLVTFLRPMEIVLTATIFLFAFLNLFRFVKKLSDAHTVKKVTLTCDLPLDNIEHESEVFLKS